MLTESDVVNSIAATRQGDWGATGGIAQEFVQDEGIATHPSVVWHETWEDGNTTGWNPFNDATGSFVITTTAANVHTGTRSLEWIIGQSTGDSGGNINRFLAAKVPRLHVRWYVKYEAAWDNSPNYQNHTGCSIRGCGTNGCTAAGVPGDGVDKFSVSLEPHQDAVTSPATVADFPPPGRLLLYTYHMDQPGNFGEKRAANVNPAASQLTLGTWHCIEIMVKVNDLGVANGEIQAWVDGVEILHEFAMRFRQVAGLLISEARFNCYIHENNARTNRMWLDDIVYATEYIGPMRMS